MQYLPFVDGLRAIAVTAVVAYHVGIPGVSGGFIGVDIFFVISGFLITSLLITELRKRDTIHLGAFFARRVRRLLPALMLVLLATGIAGAFMLLPDELPRFRQSIHSTIFVSSNFHFLNQTGGYFSPASDSMPLLHTWSLAVEEQYYIVWPMLLLLVWRLAAVHFPSRREQLILAIMIALFVLSLCASLWWSYRRQELAFYLMPMRAWELMSGGILAFLAERIRMPQELGSATAFGGLVAILATVLLVDARVVFPGWVALVPMAGTVAMILGLSYAGAGAVLARVLSSRPVVTVGLVSYSWYLWHWPLLALSRSYALSEKVLLRDLLAAAIAFGLAWLTYRYVEYPIRARRPWLFSTTRGALVAGVMMSLLTLAISASAIRFGKSMTEQRQLAWLQSVGHPELGDAKCLSMGTAQLGSPVNECAYGPGATPIRSMIWGDSHAAHLGPTAQAIATRSGERVLLRAAPGCPPLPGLLALQDHRRVDTGCAEFNDQIQAGIVRMKEAGIRNVILSARWTTYLGGPPTDPGGGFQSALVERDVFIGSGRSEADIVSLTPTDIAQSSRVFAKALDVSVGHLVRNGLNVILVAPVPELPFNAVHCLTRRDPNNCFVPRDKVDASRIAVMNAMHTVASAYPSVHVFDPVEAFCDKQRCWAFRNGVPLYRDDDHVSIAMARAFGMSLEPMLE